MWTYRYNVSGNDNRVTIPFDPYRNELKDLNGDKNWDLDGITELLQDFAHPIVTEASLKVQTPLGEKEGSFSMSKEVQLEPNTKYLITAYIRNDGVTSTRLFLNDEYKDAVTEKFTVTLLGIEDTDEEGYLKIAFEFNDKSDAAHTAWVDGFQAVALKPGEEKLRRDLLLDKYPFVLEEKKTPTASDLLKNALQGSPYRYYIEKDGIRVPNNSMELGDRGINPGDTVLVKEAPLAEAIRDAILNDPTIMTMLEGDPMKVTHAFPKEDLDMSTIANNHFPRVQFFSGDGVNKILADGRPFAEMINFATNIYVPITKVLPSVNALMIVEQLSSIMADLGWSKVRGSDYFLMQEQLYVLQSQFIKDRVIRSKRR